MSFLHVERAELERLLPGLDAELASLPFLELEQPGNPAIAAFRSHGGPGLLVPTAHGGQGASLLQMARVQRALGSRAPSLALATTMHQFSVAALADIVRLQARPGLEAMLLGQIASQSLYLASGFAEGRPGTSIFASQLRVERCIDGLRVSGSKKPCSLSRSMNLLTASLLVPAENGGPSRFAVAIIPAESQGIERRPFWTSPILAGAESDELVLDQVVVPEMHLAYLGDPAELDQVQLGGFLAFGVLLSASYLGIASGLAERVIARGRGDAAARVALAADLEGAMAAVESLARAAPEGEDDALVARSLFVRAAVLGAVERATDRAVELLGGLAFIREPEVGYLLSASRALAFHPPSRQSVAAPLAAYLAGEALRLA